MSRPNGVDVRLVPLGELEERDLSAWRELADRSAIPNPFHDPDFVLPAARALGESGEVALLVVGGGSDWSACLPVRGYPKWHRLPARTLAGWEQPYSFLRSPLLAPEDADESFRAVIGALTERSRLAGLDLLPEELTPGEDDAVVLRSDERAILRRRDEHDYLEGRVSPKHRREFRRQARLMSEQLDGEPEVVDRTGEDGAIDAFLEIEASGWKGDGGTAMGSDPAHAEFFRSAARSFAERGALELLFLECNGRVAAGRCSLIAGDGSFSFKIGFDEELKRFSPGRELELRAMDRFHAQSRINWMDSCAQPGNAYINRLWPDRRRLTTRAYFGSGAAARALRTSVRAALALRSRDAEDEDAQERSAP